MIPVPSVDCRTKSGNLREHSHQTIQPHTLGQSRRIPAAGFRVASDTHWVKFEMHMHTTFTTRQLLRTLMELYSNLIRGRRAPRYQTLCPFLSPPKQEETSTALASAIAHEQPFTDPGQRRPYANEENLYLCPWRLSHTKGLHPLTGLNPVLQHEALTGLIQVVKLEKQRVVAAARLNRAQLIWNSLLPVNCYLKTMGILRAGKARRRSRKDIYGYFFSLSLSISAFAFVIASG